METTIIREARLEDLAILKEFEQGIIHEERPYDSTLAPDPISYYDLKDKIVDPNAVVVVAEVDGQVVASGSGTIKEASPYLTHSRYAYLGFMYCLPHFRGRGINGKIITALKAWAHEKGLQEIRLRVYAGNVAAVRAYEKVGMVSHLVEMRMVTE